MIFPDLQIMAIAGLAALCVFGQTQAALDDSLNRSEPKPAQPRLLLLKELYVADLIPPEVYDRKRKEIVSADPEGAAQFATQQIVAGVPVAGKRFPPNRCLDEIMVHYLQRIGCTAAGLAVSKNRVLLYERGYGWLDKECT